MILFPLDNTLYQANGLGAWCGTRTRGVFSGEGHFAVTANGDMSVTVSPGLGWLKMDTFWGVCAFEVNPTVLAIETADGSFPRIDVICVQLNKNLNDGAVVVKKGATSPQPPIFAPPVRNLDYDEIYVAAIQVRAGATSIHTTDITPLHLNEEHCGIMRDGVTGIPTQALFDLWMAWFEEFQGDVRQFFADYSQMIINLYAQYQSDVQQHFSSYAQMVIDLFIQFEAEMAVRENNADAVYDAFVDRMSAFESMSQTNFQDFMQTIKDILNEEVAGNLLLLIQELQTRYPKNILGTVTAPATERLYPQCALFTTSWAFGIGGAGVGPAGGTEVISVEADYTFDEFDITVKVPTQYKDFINITQVSDTMFAFLSDPNETQSLVMQIYN